MTKAKIIAETGASHRKSYARCIALINASLMAGADAVKFSLFKPDEMTKDSNLPPFSIVDGQWKGKSLYELYEQSALPYFWIDDLKMATESAGMEFILSIYHPNTVPLLKDFGVHTVKIASFELSYNTLLEAISEEDHIKHVILSTGGSTAEEIENALAILGKKNVTILHCVSEYPAPIEKMNMLTMADMGIRFGLAVGLSDHTTGIISSVVAVSMGATVIEKHIKLDNDGLDSSFAVFPDRFKCMVNACREAEKIIGYVKYSEHKTYHRADIEGEYLRKVW